MNMKQRMKTRNPLKRNQQARRRLRNQRTTSRNPMMTRRSRRSLVMTPSKRKTSRRTSPRLRPKMTPKRTQKTTRKRTSPTILPARVEMTKTHQQPLTTKTTMSLTVKNQALVLQVKLIRVATRVLAKVKRRALVNHKRLKEKDP